MPEIVLGAFAGVDVQRSGENLGFGRGHNANAKRGRSAWLLVINQDCILEPGALERLVETAEKDDARVAAWEMRQIPYEHPKAYDPATLDAPWASGAATLFRREAYEAVGGFDEAIFMYGEDVDLSWRLRATRLAHHLPAAVRRRAPHLQGGGRGEAPAGLGRRADEPVPAHALRRARAHRAGLHDARGRDRHAARLSRPAPRPRPRGPQGDREGPALPPLARRLHAGLPAAVHRLGLRDAPRRRLPRVPLAPGEPGRAAAEGLHPHPHGEPHGVAAPGARLLRQPDLGEPRGGHRGGRRARLAAPSSTRSATASTSATRRRAAAAGARAPATAPSPSPPASG